ncbi:RNA polymerase II transcription factor B subunit 5 [Myxozyma melibiosi]|uniref:General transcription and DNA repair factor IIH subunit TFB5 n=1 Tax=Myxozyma melibiosi TaxID=54550 RepID=A0ABR1EYD0_9ASCO
MPRAVKGVFVECDPSIKSLVLNIDAKSHNVVIADLDDEHLVIDERQVDNVKRQLDAQLAENTFNPAELENNPEK